MPDVAVHASFSKEVLRSLPPEIRGAILRDPYDFGAYGPDLWFMHRPWVRREGRGRRMHTTRTGAFLTALARQGKTGGSRAELFSYLAGFLCHYALDAEAHPYIIRRTTTEFHYPRAHMSFEHSLDVCQMARDGVWGEKHPVTEHYFLPLSLPASMARDLDAVYREVYGWPDCTRALNRAFRRYRRCYRAMENPRGLAAFLARRAKKSVLPALVYSESFFREVDVENEVGAEWRHSHEDSLRSQETFAQLREKARRRAVEMIEAAWRWIYMDQGTEEDLARLIGNDSYLSGLPVDDPRNLNVPSLLPPETNLK